MNNKLILLAIIVFVFFVPIIPDGSGGYYTISGLGGLWQYLPGAYYYSGHYGFCLYGNYCPIQT